MPSILYIIVHQSHWLLIAAKERWLIEVLNVEGIPSATFLISRAIIFQRRVSVLQRARGGLKALLVGRKVRVSEILCVRHIKARLFRNYLKLTRRLSNGAINSPQAETLGSSMIDGFSPKKLWRHEKHFALIF
jgi:hypothetical protein